MWSIRRADEWSNKHYNNKGLRGSWKDIDWYQETWFQQSRISRDIRLQILGEDQIYICAS